jgi:ABC-type sugar transport system ATPase subunit
MPKRDASLAEAETVRSNVCMPDVSPDHRRTGLHLAGISKSYGATRVVCDVDLSVDRGEVVALMGANGAGKSTLAKIASGVVQPDSGHILVAGHAVKLAGPQGARSHGIFIVHQSTDQLGVPGLSVAENLVLDELCNGKIGRFTNRRMIRLRAQAIAANVGLDLPLDRDYGELGPGHRQLIAVARAVATKASILIFDEPTASLGASEAARLFAVIDRLRTSGVGILYISHRLADLRRIADRLVILRNGQIVTQQARPLDFRLAIQTMIGRDLQGATVNRSDSLAGQTVLDLRGVQLTRNAKPFDSRSVRVRLLPLQVLWGQVKAGFLGRHLVCRGLRPARSVYMARDGSQRDLVRPFGTESLWLAKIAGILRFYLRPRWEEISPARSRCRIGHTGSHSVLFAEQKSSPPPQRRSRRSASAVAVPTTQWISSQAVISKKWS